jgi:hypothetical protein
MTTTYISEPVKQAAKPSGKDKQDITKNYTNPEPLNVSHVGKSITVTLINNRTEAGILRKLGQYTMEIELPSKRSMIINKSAIITVVIL